jgi:hypothetical protein
MRSYLLSGVGAASMLLTLTTVAQAADMEVAAEPDDSGWYVAIFGGWAAGGEIDHDLSGVSSGLNDGVIAGIAMGHPGRRPASG